ncbi:MAG: B-box zinc finger protein [Chloroflexota bacterium]
MTSTASYCVNHPRRETSLRCNRCDKLICSQCAIHTPTGYRCKTCIRSQQKSFDTAQWYDYVSASVVAGLLSYFGALIATRLGFFLIIIAPLIGTGIAEAVRIATGKRRSKQLFLVTAAAILLGSSPLVIWRLLVLLAAFSQGSEVGIYSVLDIIKLAVYLGIATPTAYYRIRGLYFKS